MSFGLHGLCKQEDTSWDFYPVYIEKGFKDIMARFSPYSNNAKLFQCPEPSSKAHVMRKNTSVHLICIRLSF